jgi:hypothetical protein
MKQAQQNEKLISSRTTLKKPVDSLNTPVSS